MAGVLEQLIRPHKRVVVYCNPKALELQTAKEILAEVFRVRLSEVDEMIRCRFEAEDMGTKEEGLWPAGVLAGIGASLPEPSPSLSPGLFLNWWQAHCMPKRSFIARTSDCTCRKCIPYPGWMSSLSPLISSSTWGIVSVFLRTALMSSLI